MDKVFSDISEKMIERYSKRYEELGYNVRTLGWGTEEQQIYRFKQSLPMITFSNSKSILDIGCGFGDYLTLLLVDNKPFKQYIGWDLNPDLIAKSKNIWQKNHNSHFEVKNIAEIKEKIPVAEIGVMFGILNLNFNEKIDNYDYAFQFIRNAFSLVSEVLVVDFLSSRTNSDYPREDFVFYYDPGRMLEFALTLTPNVILKHDYAPIPQKEFMLFLYK